MNEENYKQVIVNTDVIKSFSNIIFNNVFIYFEQGEKAIMYSTWDKDKKTLLNAYETIVRLWTIQTMEIIIYSSYPFAIMNTNFRLGVTKTNSNLFCMQMIEMSKNWNSDIHF